MVLPGWSKVISTVFHPLFMLVGGTLIAFVFDSTFQVMFQTEKIGMTLIILTLGTILFPLINFMILKRTGVINSLEMESHKERVIPFITALVYYVLVYILLRRILLPESFYALFFGTILALAITVVITIFTKISIHSVAAAGVLGMITGLFQIHGTGNAGVLMMLILLTGIIMSARLNENAHTPGQVYAGAVLGFLCTYSSIVNGWMI